MITFHLKPGDAVDVGEHRLAILSKGCRSVRCTLEGRQIVELLFDSPRELWPGVTVWARHVSRWRLKLSIEAPREIPIVRVPFGRRDVA